ncbi:alpha/beta hydrolase [uncultured Lactobacillus sp.]|uniref:alpha/beta fold hydrolase n=1 Tax=uncultured Lactobacillus sp. TaxID=153152 RepID=UPI00280580DD|nr:alpha/beta hydrolase [uncultured Lactobacillus sp.]
MFFKTSDDVKIAYSINGKGKPIILITGFGGYQEIWTAQKQYLLQMGYQVITYDHRNMGKSERTAKGQTLSRLTQDLIELLNFLQISQAVFVGHSMGGSVIYNLLKVKPEIIKFAIIIDQSPYMLNTSNWHYGFMNYTKDNFKQETLKVPNVKETLNGVAPQIAVEVAKAKVDYPFNRQNNIKLLQEHSSIDWRPVVMNTRIPINVVAAK